MEKWQFGIEMLLTSTARRRKSLVAMQHHLIRNSAMLAFGASLLVLSGCKSKPESMNVGTGDPMAEQLANAVPVELPPMLRESKTYRCKDNSLVFVDFMTDDVTVHFKTKKEGPITKLKATAKGEVFSSADGSTKVEGNGDTVTVTMPGKGAQLCKS